MTAPSLTQQQRWEIEDCLSRAFDHGVASHPITRQAFAWMVLSHLLGGLSAIGAIGVLQEHHFQTLSDHYATTQPREEVKN